MRRVHSDLAYQYWFEEIRRQLRTVHGAAAVILWKAFRLTFFSNLLVGNASPAKMVSWLKDSAYEQVEEEDPESYEMKHGRRNGDA